MSDELAMNVTSGTAAKCGPWTASNGETQEIHVCKPGSAACQCGRFVYPVRATPDYPPPTR